MAKKIDLGKIRKEAAEVQAEKANVAARMAELDRRLSDDSSSLAELRTAGDELADARGYMRALDKRLVGLGQQRQEAEREEKKARIAALQQEEDAAYAEFCEAVDQFAEGPQQALLDVQRAIYDAAGIPQHGRARTVVRGVSKFQRMQAAFGNRAEWERRRGLLK